MVDATLVTASDADGGILHALSDPEHVAIFSQIARSGCVNTCAAAASADDRVIPKSSLSNHIRVLREAGLIRSERNGAELPNFSRCTGLDKRFPGLLSAILDAYSLRSAVPKQASGDSREAGA
jgi:DNA-binding transcriptional ArsR family regulator